MVNPFTFLGLHILIGKNKNIGEALRINNLAPNPTMLMVGEQNLASNSLIQKRVPGKSPLMCVD